MASSDQLALQIEYDPRRWLPVPTTFPSAEDRTAAKWAARVARERTDWQTGTPVENLLRRAAGKAEHDFVDQDEVWLLRPDDGSTLLLAMLDCGPADQSPEDALKMMREPDSGNAQPELTRVHSAQLGDGTRTLRVEADANGLPSWSSFTWFRVHDADVIALASHRDRAMLERAVPYLDQLLDGVRLGPGGPTRTAKPGTGATQPPKRRSSLARFVDWFREPK